MKMKSCCPRGASCGEAAIVQPLSDANLPADRPRPVRTRKENMSIKVIGTGFGRTGTDSMREALTILGLGPCHHMSEVIANEEQKRLWRALAKGAAPDWSELFAGYASC